MSCHINPSASSEPPILALGRLDHALEAEEAVRRPEPYAASMSGRGQLASK
jgi:hypothetical protein